MLLKDLRSDTEKLYLFRKRFVGLSHVYGTYDPSNGRSWQVKQPVTDKVIKEHLRGKRPLGLYLLTGTRIYALAVDYDTQDANLPLDFVNAARCYELVGHIEVSKSKGFHVWLFFESSGVSAAKARMAVRHILKEIHHHVEVFPKQDKIDVARGEVGNFINLPLFGGLVPTGRTIFLEGRKSLQPVSNQWRYLENIKPIPETLLDSIIEINDLSINEPSSLKLGQSIGVFQSSWGLPPCARRMLNEGVRENQRVSCFRLALHLRRLGIPYDLVIATLAAWRDKNRPNEGRRIITTSEVRQQVTSAFTKDYKGMGCQEPAMSEFCDESCALFSREKVSSSI